jgi:hypothetical protein
VYSWRHYLISCSAGILCGNYDGVENGVYDVPDNGYVCFDAVTFGVADVMRLEGRGLA